MKKVINPELNKDIEIILKEIGSRIREQRKSVAGNYEDFAKEHGFNKVTVSRIEQGKNSSLKSIITFARVLNIKLEDLFKGLQ